ncbi:hypothetical protein Ddc_14880 [Ditylenchus destructor]|nr:hypothetical protein Ddc_14880 [Ditylenchus destructor]
MSQDAEDCVQKREIERSLVGLGTAHGPPPSPPSRSRPTEREPPQRASRHSERACISNRLPASQPISDEHNVAIWTRRGAVGGASAEKKRDMGRADEGSLYFSLLHAILCVLALKTASRVLKAGTDCPPVGR